VPGYLLYLSKPTGYELQPMDGDAPSVGDSVESGEQTLRIMKLGPSPVPGDDRRCAYAEPTK
jgi:hypothetical protein